MNRKVLVIFISILILFILLVPKKEAYFQRIAVDYGEIHHNSRLTSKVLMDIGDFEYHNRLLYSQFEYQFGNTSVNYYGFLNFIVFDTSEIISRKSPPVTI